MKKLLNSEIREKPTIMTKKFLYKRTDFELGSSENEQSYPFRSWKNVQIFEAERTLEREVQKPCKGLYLVIDFI